MLVEGLIRVTVFVAYLVLISLLPDLRRVFQYHAAEHKAINAYEAGEELEPQTVQRFSLIHPRCGTAFLLWVMVIAIFVFAFFGRPAWYWLIATRILLLPVIAGIAYELIRFAGKHTGNRVVMTLLAPGLWLQRLTTREPTLDQLEVSIRALREVLALEGRDQGPASASRRGDGLGAACRRRRRGRAGRDARAAVSLARAAGRAATKLTRGSRSPAARRRCAPRTTANSGETSSRPVACALRRTSEIRPVRAEVRVRDLLCAADIVSTRLALARSWRQATPASGPERVRHRAAGGTRAGRRTRRRGCSRLVAATGLTAPRIGAGADRAERVSDDRGGRSGRAAVQADGARARGTPTIQVPDEIVDRRGERRHRGRQPTGAAAAR